MTPAQVDLYLRYAQERIEKMFGDDESEPEVKNAPTVSKNVYSSLMGKPVNVLKVIDGN